MKNVLSQFSKFMIGSNKLLVFSLSLFFLAIFSFGGKTFAQSDYGATPDDESMVEEMIDDAGDMVSENIDKVVSGSEDMADSVMEKTEDMADSVMEKTEGMADSVIEKMSDMSPETDSNWMKLLYTGGVFLALLVLGFILSLFGKGIKASPLWFKLIVAVVSIGAVVIIWI